MDDQTLDATLKEIFSLIREQQAALASHTAREEERDKAIQSAMEGVLKEVEGIGKIMATGKGFAMAIIFIVAGIWTVGSWLFDHFAITPK